MEQKKHRAWAEVNLGAVEHNFQVIRKHVGTTPIMAVVKADAYGHGSVRVAERLAKAGAARFAVATVQEAVELRESGIVQPILVLGYVNDVEAELLAVHDIAAAVYNRQVAAVFSQAAKAVGRRVQVHIALDTGMTRLGFPAGNAQRTAEEIAEVAALAGLEVEGMFTHFAVADALDGEAFTLQQLDAFRAVDEALRSKGIHIPVRHCANSGGVLQYKNGYFDIVRAGILLYGYHPDPALPHTLDLWPAMTLKARVVQVRDVFPGQTISYGRTYVVKQPIREAVISIGYADGYLRTSSGRAQIVIGGKRADVLGRICMDMCMAAVPQGVEVKQGDEVTIYGNDIVTADDVAAAAGTISYELLCAVSARVPRIYLG